MSTLVNLRFLKLDLFELTDALRVMFITDIRFLNEGLEIGEATKSHVGAVCLSVVLISGALLL